MNVLEVVSGSLYYSNSSYYTVYLNAGTVYTVDMRGSGSGAGTMYNPYVQLYTPTGSYLGYDDDSGAGPDAKFTFLAVTSGYYQIYAQNNSYYSGGSYQLTVSPTASTLFGDDYSNGLNGTTGDDTVYGLGGADTLYGDTGNDYLLGGAGNDTIAPGAGNDTIYGGDGQDRVSFADDTGLLGVAINLRTDIATRGSETDRLYEIEDATGSVNADTLDGDDAANQLNGHDGADTIRGAGGSDTLQGGLGDDQITGGGGNDTIDGGGDSDTAVFAGALSEYNIVLQGGGSFSVQHARGTQADGTDTLTGVEYARFADRTVSLGDLTSPTLSIAAADASKAEGTGGSTAFTFTVTRDGNPYQPASVDWAVSGAGASPAGAADFVGGVLPAGTLSFAAGETSKTITVNVAGDFLFEAGESFAVTLTRATGATLVTASAAGTIQNDDLPPSLAIAALSADKAEGSGTATDFTFTVTRSGDSSTAVSAAWAVSGSGASPANAADFVGGALPFGLVSFAAGETSRTITVSVAGDYGFEASEGFTVTLASPTGGATIATGTASGTIQNDDPSGPVPIVGDDLANTLYGTAAADVIQGLGGDDRLYGYGGDDRLEGGGGYDIIEPGFGNDTVYGGTETDKVSYYNDAGTAGLVIDLRTDIATRGAETDRLYDIEDIDGGRGNDTIDGDDGANYLSGADGNDVVRAWGGNDTLRGGIGDDVLEPGAGVDTVYGGPGTDKVSYYNETGTAGVTIDLAAGTAVRSGQTDTLYEIENADGTRNADTIYGSAAVNLLGGADGNDLLYGRAGNDTLLGSGGNDRLLGEAGKDVLTGGAGVDTFDFDRVADSAWTSGRTACDRITDFVHLSDKIDLSTIDAKSTTAANEAFTFLATKGAAITAIGQIHWYQSGGNTYIEANTGGSTAPELQIQIDGLRTITAADFVL